MNFMDATKTCLTKYASFNGRATRSEYWWFILFVAIAQGIAMSLSQNLQAVVSLVLLLPNLAVAVRRLHDVNRSGWWYWVVLIPLIGVIVLIYWFVTEGTQGANDYGNPSA